jgi:hypothetical protein
MRLTSMDISFKYTAGLLNVEETFHIAFEDNERVNMIGWIQDKVRERETAGFEPPVVKVHNPLASPTAKSNGATGKHPDDLEPWLNQAGKQKLCPECGEPLYIKTIKFKAGRRAGEWGNMSIHAKKGTCKFVEFGD